MVSQLNALELRADQTKHRDRIRSHANRYVAFCKAHGLKAFSPGYRSIATYVCDYVRLNNGSSKSVRHVISYLRVFCHYIGCEWLSMDATYRLKTLVKRIEFEDLLAVHRAAPITTVMLLELFGKIDPSDQQQFMTIMAMFVAHDGLLRSAELLKGLQVKDIQWCVEDASFLIFLDRTKTGRSGQGQYVRVCDYPGPCAYKLLKLWFDAHDLYRRPDSHILPRVIYLQKREIGSAYRLDFTQTVTAYWWKLVIRRSMISIGRDPNIHTGHSFRPGGATDLFAMGVSYAMVKQIGRWKSEAAMDYLRDELEVAQTVAAAFGEIARRRGKGMGVVKEFTPDFHR